MERRRIVFVRHGERVDRVFSNEWIKSCFTEKDPDKYIKHNLNMPDEVPKREGSPRSFHNDCPLTQIGVHQATLTGKGLLDEKILRDGFQVYVSPALRCVQTATALLNGMKIEKNQNPSLKIEPCLFEWTDWYGDFMPKWMSNEEFQQNNYNVDLSYVPFIRPEDLKYETSDNYYKRSSQVAGHLIKSTDKDLLIVAHGISWDALTRELMGRSSPDNAEVMQLLPITPYCGIAVAEKNDHDKWKLIPTPGITLCHHSAFDFDASKVQVGL